MRNANGQGLGLVQSCISLKKHFEKPLESDEVDDREMSRFPVASRMSWLRGTERANKREKCSSCARRLSKCPFSQDIRKDEPHSAPFSGDSKRPCSLKKLPLIPEWSFSCCGFLTRSIKLYLSQIDHGAFEFPTITMILSWKPAVHWKSCHLCRWPSENAAGLRSESSDSSDDASMQSQPLWSSSRSWDNDFDD
jgi:hypothetical protein